MASGSFEFLASGYLQGKINWSSTSNGSSANTSTVTAILYARRTNEYTTWGQSWSGYVKIASTQVNINFSSSVTVGSSWVEMARVTETVAHNNSGTGSVYISGSVTGPSGTALAGNTSAGGKTVTLDTIPRYTSITTFTVSKRNETSFTFTWGTADTIDYAWYSTNNGSNWTGIDVTDGKSGTFTVSGLTPNTSYNCKLRVRRKDSQLTTDSSVVSQKTYAVPTQSLNSKTETTVKINWTVDSTADYIWYSTNNGSSWTAVGSVNATSGNYTITGLNANTAYNIKTRVRRKASQTSYDTTALSVTTYKVPTQSLNTKTLNSIKMNWSCDSTVDYIWYSTNNGSNWTGIDVTDGTSGTYTVSNLTPNTTYTLKTRCRRKATQTTYDTTSLSVTTYDIAKISSAPNIDHGNSLTVTYTNPSSSNLQIGIFKTDGTTAIASYRNCSGSSYTFNFTDTELDTIYKMYGTNNTVAVRIYLKTANNSSYLNYKNITVTLKGNQKTAYVGSSGAKRAKVYVGVNGSVKKAVVWIGNNGKKRCI